MAKDSCHINAETARTFNYVYLTWDSVAVKVTFIALCSSLGSCREMGTGPLPGNGRSLLETKRRYMVLALVLLFLSPVLAF